MRGCKVVMTLCVVDVGVLDVWLLADVCVDVTACIDRITRRVSVCNSISRYERRRRSSDRNTAKRTPEVHIRGGIMMDDGSSCRHDAMGVAHHDMMQSTSAYCYDGRRPVCRCLVCWQGLLLVRGQFDAMKAMRGEQRCVLVSKSVS